MSQQEPKLRKRSRHNLRRHRPLRLLGNPQVRIPPPKPRRHNSNQRSGYAIQHKRLVHDSRIGAETLHPRLVAQHEHRWRPRLVIRRLHHPPQLRRHPQKLKCPRRHVVPVETLRPFSSAVQHVRVVIGDHPIKYMILLHIVQKLRPAEPRPPSGLRSFRVVNLHGHESLRIRVRKRLHQDVFNHAENRRGRPDSQRQRDHRHRRKSRSLSQIPQRIPDILPWRSHVHPQFDRSPLHQPLLPQLQAPPIPSRRAKLVPAPSGARLFSVCCSGGSLDPLFILFQSTHTPANKFDGSAHNMSPNPLLALEFAICGGGLQYALFLASQDALSGIFVLQSK